MSCLKKERKPMVPLKQLDIIFRRRYVQNTQFYFTNRKHTVPETVPRKRSSPFRVPRSEKLLSYIKFSDRKEKLITRERLSQPLHKKDNLRIAATRDISKRLYVPEPPDDVKAVVEIHPEFYTVIEGRPLRAFDDIKVYCTNIRNYSMTRQQIGYRRDLILKINQNIADEGKELEAITESLRHHIKNFQRFLTDDYKKACVKVSKAEKVFQDLQAKNSEFLGYVSIITILNNVIFKLDAIRNILKTYRRYLMFIAPLPWRQVNDETLKDKAKSTLIEIGEFVTDKDLAEFLDIDRMVDQARTELQNPFPNVLYFKHPAQMMYIFRTMEMQSREYLTQLTLTDIPFRLLQDRIEQLKLATKQEQDYFQYYIDSINNEIDRELYNESHLEEKFFRILNESFYDSVASPTTLKLKICIEYVYEQVFGKCEEGHQTLRDPMKILEVMYEDYNMRLDSLDFKTVNQARSDFFRQDLKMMTDAYKAQRELRTFREMTNSLNKAFLAPAKFTRPVLGKFVNVASMKAQMAEEKIKTRLAAGERMKKKKFKVSPDDYDALVLFTEWCEGTNPAPFLNQYATYVKPVFDTEFDTF